jgi:hypothetical protein
MDALSVDSRPMGIYVKYIGAVLGVCILGALALLLFEDIWLQRGIGAAILVICGGLLLFAWLADRKAREAREGLEDI